MDFFSPAQIVGYVAFVLGVSSFLQKSDRRLIVFNASQCVVYTVHFLLLGNYTAAGSAAVSAIRSGVALRFQAKFLAWVFMAANLAVGVLVAKSPAGWLPVIGCFVATYGLFYLKGVALRLAFLSSTVMWIANNVISGSIGGMALETTIFLTNGTTIIRMLRNPKAFAPASKQGKAPQAAE